MLFNTIEYAMFLPIVFAIYWLLSKNLKLQNIFVVLASYVFYAWWDWRFLGLLFGMSLISWLGGKYISFVQNKANASGGGAIVIRSEITPHIYYCTRCNGIGSI